MAQKKQKPAWKVNPEIFSNINGVNTITIDQPRTNTVNTIDYYLDHRKPKRERVSEGKRHTKIIEQALNLYEDTGLTPKELVEYIKDLGERYTLVDEKINKLKDYKL